MDMDEEAEVQLQLLLLVSDSGTVQLQLHFAPMSQALGAARADSSSEIDVAASPPIPDPELKHLQFVARRSRALVEKAGKLYCSIRSSALPTSSSINALEEHVTTVILHPLAAVAHSTLRSLDGRLDALLLRLAPYSPTHKDAPAAWAQLPYVGTLCRTLEPAARLGLSALHTLHDYVVPSPYYKTALDLTSGGLSYASSLPPYKLASNFIYPMVQPVADAALSQLNSDAVHAVLDYWKPTATPSNSTSSSTSASTRTSTSSSSNEPLPTVTASNSSSISSKEPLPTSNGSASADPPPS